MRSALFPETGMIHHFRATALFTLTAIISLVISGCGSTATSAPGTPAAGTSAATSAGASGSASAATQPPTIPAATGAPSASGRLHA